MAWPWLRSWGRDTLSRRTATSNKRGEWAIEPQFARASCFVEALAAAAVVNEAFDPPPPEHNPYYDEDADPKLLWGFIDKNGRWVIEPQYYSVQSFSEGIAWVKTRVMLPEKDPKTGLASKIVNAYIDKTGKAIRQEQ
ncbi:MAG: WG repeat-containing protein [Thermoleophilia bacterium]|nr:WG repeat-containing protein [Thermoleophilia bacterium]